MDSLVEKYSAASINFNFQHPSSSIYSENRCRNRINHEYINFTGSSNDSSSEGRDESTEEVDYSDAMLNYVSQMLMDEEDIEHRPCILQDCLALQATEKYFYDALHQPKCIRGFAIDGNLDRADHDDGDGGLSRTYSSQCSESSSGINSWICNQGDLESSPAQFAQSLISTNQDQELFNPREYKQVDNFLVNDSKGKIHHRVRDTDSAEDIRSNKLLASSVASDSDSDVSPEEALVLFSVPKELSEITEEKLQKSKRTKQRRPRFGKTQGNIIRKEVVDLRNLLTQCAQAVANYDTRTANELFKKIKQHSSPHGDATERLAHYLSNALEARMEGGGTKLYASYGFKRISTTDILKSYKVYIMACPYKTMSNIFANNYIKKVASGAKKLHIIDFGIVYGFQWPCLIQGLSERPGGPPKLRITGIDFPQPGFKPAERVEETGIRLGKYCKRFNVPFEYKAIAKKWETIQIEDLQIESDEVVAVNCINRLENVPDLSVSSLSPRDTVLKLIKRIKPDIFVHGVTNGTYNSPFFVTRFREALYQFSALFDMFEAIVPQRDNEERKLFEKEMYGRDAMNVIAFEGTERVHRPETYKQWQVRNVRAGFKQLSLDREIVNYVSDKVKKCYHKDFIVDQDGNWMLQGWKGKVIFALSCWKAVDKKHENVDSN